MTNIVQKAATQNLEKIEEFCNIVMNSKALFQSFKPKPITLAYIGATYRTAHYTIRYKSIWMTVYEDWVSKEECGITGMFNRIEWNRLSSAKKKPLTDQGPFFTL